MTITRKTIGSIVGFAVIMLAIFRGQAIENTIESHHWVGVALLICAIAFTLWGMFWRKEDKT
jgi:hypothetical protein